MPSPAEALSTVGRMSHNWLCAAEHLRPRESAVRAERAHTTREVPVRRKDSKWECVKCGANVEGVPVGRIPHVRIEIGHGLGPVIQPRVARKVVEAAGGAGTWIGGAEHHERYPRRPYRARAHRARLQGHNQRVIVEPP